MGGGGWNSNTLQMEFIHFISLKGGEFSPHHCHSQHLCHRSAFPSQRRSDEVLKTLPLAVVCHTQWRGGVPFINLDALSVSSEISKKICRCTDMYMHSFFKLSRPFMSKLVACPLPAAQSPPVQHPSTPPSTAGPLHGHNNRIICQYNIVILNCVLGMGIVFSHTRKSFCNRGLMTSYIKLPKNHMHVQWQVEWYYAPNKGLCLWSTAMPANICENPAKSLSETHLNSLAEQVAQSLASSEFLLQWGLYHG